MADITELYPTPTNTGRLDTDVRSKIPGRDPAEIERSGRVVGAELRHEPFRDYAQQHGLRSDEEVALHQYTTAGGEPWRHERFTDGNGIPSADVLMRVNAVDLDAFQDLCDLEWGSLTYREGFRRLLELAGVAPELDRSAGGREQFADDGGQTAVGSEPSRSPRGPNS